MKLQKTADECNSRLAEAGVEYRWVFDDNPDSNSVGTWFCCVMGGVSDAKTMRNYTRALIPPARQP